MRCNECNYPLWNTPAGNCPECGKPFKPSTHAFAVGEVRFRCPEPACNQDYFGDDLDGHLRPNQFTCISCGREVHEDECLLFPADGNMDAVAEVRMPLLDSTKGAFKRWLGTIGWSMTQPGRLMAGVPNNTGVGVGARFALITFGFVLLVGYLPVLLISVLPMMFGGGVGPVGILAIGPAVIIPAIVFVLVGVQIALAHGLLAVTGATAHGFGRTALAVLLATGPFALMATPCVGGCASPIAGVWWMVSSIVMLMVGQKVSGIRATLAVLLLPVGGIGIYVVGLVWFVTVGSFNPFGGNAMLGPGVGGAQLAITVHDVFEDKGSMPSFDEFNRQFVDVSGTLIGETAVEFADGGASGWWSGNVFVCGWAADERNDRRLTVLVWEKKDGSLSTSTWVGTSSASRSSSGLSLMKMVEGAQEGFAEDGYPQIPSEPLQAWVASLEGDE